MSSIDKSMKISSYKDKINISRPMVGIPDIKLIRTDTTLDLSQKAEKNARRRQSSKTASRRRRQGQTCGTEAYAHPERRPARPTLKACAGHRHRAALDPTHTCATPRDAQALAHPAMQRQPPGPPAARHRRRQPHNQSRGKIPSIQARPPR